MKKALLPLLLLLIAMTGFAQSGKYWVTNNQSKGSILTDKAVSRSAFPKEFKLFDLNLSSMRNELFKVVNNAQSHSVTISLPNADGKMEAFEVFEASNFEPALQAQFPEIRAFSGKGITDKYASLKLSISPQGIQTMVFRTGKENEFIEPYSQDHHTYAVFKSQRVKGSLPWTCSTQDHEMFAGINPQVAGRENPESSAGELKTLRLAQSCNGEYSNYFGAFNATQVGLVLAAFNATLTRCNGVYEKDLAIHLNLISNTTDVIYYDGTTDPYTTLGNWNTQLMNTLHNIIGDANFDIGHMFGASGGGGNAGCIGCVCNNTLATGGGANSSYKGAGITSPADGIPQGDNFDIDYVVHEVGHQLGANHTFSMSTEGTGVNKEVGSGITIMGYAGITAHDVAPHSIDIFHEASIQQIQTNMITRTCAVTTNITANNATPVIAPLSNYTIPISTPFALTGSATDANAGDVLTYCWEQNDDGTGQTGTNSRARENKPTGPNWLSFSPTTSPTRICPQLATILAGGYTTGPLPGGDAGVLIEALSNVSRTLNFRLTVRDNSVYSSTAPIKVGQTSFADMVVTVTNTSGPFAVTSPNTNVSWAGGSTQTITWDVANTTTAPVSCANVRILLSTDGGFTFPTVLSATTANDGSEVVTLPSTTSTTARVKIESIGNIFFDISNTNFTITQPAVTFNFVTPAATNVPCGSGTTASSTVATTSAGGFSTPINLSATAGVPAGTTVSFGTNPVNPGSSSTVVLNNVNTLAPGTYNITVTGVAGAETKTVVVSFVVPSANPVITTQPAATAACVGTVASFSVAATGGVSYQWQVSTNGGTSFTNITSATAATYSISSVTAAMANNQYRVVITGQCGTTTSSAAVLTVNLPVTITTQPTDKSICVGDNATFSVTATGGTITYQWQVKVGSTFVNVNNTAPYSGATTATLTLTAPPKALNGTEYRVIVSGPPCGDVISSVAKLVINDIPGVVLVAAEYNNITPYTPSGLYSTVSPPGSYTYAWYQNGSLVTSQTGSSIAPVTVDWFGDYYVQVTDANGCSKISNTVKIADSVSSMLFIYPNPSSGIFQVRYYSNSQTEFSLNVFDSKGARVWYKKYPVSARYEQMIVDLTRNAAGTYSVEVRDASGKRLKAGKVVIQH
ncbi:MAG: zinc-dependent metalloprotease family protein [Ferruginibacter sp.]